MKPLLSVLVFSAVCLFSCKKEDDTPPAPPTVSELLCGTYVGPSAFRSTRRIEVFTSQYESHYEWVKDSVFTEYDTLRVREVNRDSFVMEGRIGAILSQWWDRFAWNEVVDSNGVYTLDKGFWYSSGSSGFTLIFDVENQTAEVFKKSSDYSSWENATFLGTK